MKGSSRIFSRSADFLKLPNGILFEMITSTGQYIIDSDGRLKGHESILALEEIFNNRVGLLSEERLEWFVKDGLHPMVKEKSELYKKKIFSYLGSPQKLSRLVTGDGEVARWADCALRQTCGEELKPGIAVV